MASILDQIVAHKFAEVAANRERRPLAELKTQVADAPPPRDFLAALREADSPALIAEIKQASPSKGVICADFRPLEIARIYANEGAAAISVLTDEQFFRGSLDVLTQVRQTVSLPVLRKDFIIDEYQVTEARVAGADALLLIAECLPSPRLQQLHRLTCELGMTPLVELYDADNLPRVLELEPLLVGVNSRDLRTFQVDLDRTVELRKQVPRDVLFVAESGIACRTDVERLAAGGVDAMLVGETLMGADDMAAKIRQILPNREE